MRKEPYQHIVIFKAQSQGNWTTVHSGNRYELIGNPEEGNASTRINQLSVRDNHTYLCHVEYRSRLNSQYLIQKDTRLQVHEMIQVHPALLRLLRPNSHLIQVFSSHQLVERPVKRVPVCET
ncbi:sialic acid-binding Ig-like lectin 15 isoform X2 [Chiloscyllium plagiosum]|uniref:sialic acid-binding Ig-like lectin 15 isoform X2 n=1 Tax=Chiloscyllium plagiosum TaxID=36176 RepID=UPI001CB7E338|nr:sialic acid-binding Ig-like lectin 15 isoform X2 [Chiloscyllium plagiosum]